MNSEVTHREVDLKLNRSIIVDQVAAFLYATGVANDDEEITNIQFKELFMDGAGPEICPIKVFIKKEVREEPSTVH